MLTMLSCACFFCGFAVLSVMADQVRLYLLMLSLECGGPVQLNLWG
jgi:hypothetical protein